MKRIAIIKLGTLEIKMNIAEIMPNQTFIMIDEFREPTRIIEDFENDVPISKTRISEVLATLNNFKAICVSKKIDEVYCYAEYCYKNLKNEHSFFEQLSSKTGYRFVILGYKEYVDYIYTAIVCSMNITKGIFINIEEERSYIVQYNRRMVVNQVSAPIGYSNSLYKLKDNDSESRYEYVENIIKELFNSVDSEWLKNMPADTITVLQGDIFKNISKVVRKKTRYPYDRDQNFVTNKTDLLNACDEISQMPFDAKKKLKGTSFRADAMVMGANIAKAIISNIPYLDINYVPAEKKEITDIDQTDTIIKDIDNEILDGELSLERDVEQNMKAQNSIFICEFDLPYGSLFKLVSENTSVPYKPVDVLDFSLSALTAYYGPDSNSDYVCRLSALIFKQLRVLHKLNRYFLNVLKIAARLYNAGERINPFEMDKYSYQALINSPIFGTQHREILLAGFVLMCQNSENFSLTEWVKYRSIIVKDGEDEAELKLACQRLAVILKLARAFDRYSNSRILNIECDNLGECVIMKTTMSINSTLEIREARKLDAEFRKVFNNKKIEIL